jgi:hypothetical protein
MDMNQPLPSRAASLGLLGWSVRLHKWISLAVGLQVLFWILGGLVMTAIPIGIVRGEHHAPPPAAAGLDVAGLVPLAEAVQAAGFDPVKAELRQTPRGAVWMLSRSKGDPVTLDARTARPLAAFKAEDALDLARQGYAGDAAPVSARLLAEAPQETGKSGPLWRVDFDDPERTALYLSPVTGETVSRRSNVWRFYDLFWRLHIMDWPTGEDFNNPLVIAAAAISLVLLYQRLARRQGPSRLTSTAIEPPMGE